MAGRFWSKQRQIAETLRDHKRVAVRSGHSTGKTRVAASLAAWWIDVHPPGEAIVITTAATFAQFSQVFWQELRRIWKFRNTRCASLWAMRELLDPAMGAVLALPLPDEDDELAVEISMPKWAPAANGYLDIETKPELKKRLGRSPDRADAVAMACWAKRPDGRSTRDDDPWQLHDRLKPVEYTFRDATFEPPAG
ncbi:MAG: hypothetical protein M3Z25_14835 [Actinomycetota bacterium]|nr:hypothetical protein [Actinomycetota bacterium]